MDGTMSRRVFLATSGSALSPVLLAASPPAWSTSRPTILSALMRREIRSLSTTDLERLRIAFRELQKKTGAGGYQDLAGMHGKPKWFCDHGTLFVPWHRAYIKQFEDALRTFDSSVTLPFWDWTSPDSIKNGIPKQLSEPECIISGNKEANPLFRAYIQVDGRYTQRKPGDPKELASYAKAVVQCFNKTSYPSFNGNLYDPHGDLHVWVGGDMSSVPLAAYDPIFWFHHANVDRQWAQWQLGKNNADPSSSIQGQDLKPFGVKVAKVIDYKKELDYDYEGITPMPPRDHIVTAKGSTFTIPQVDLTQMTNKAYLYIHGIRPSPESYHIRVFINQPDANEKTPIKDNPHYAGSFGIFGVGEQVEGHAAEKRTHGMEERERSLDISEAIVKLGQGQQKSDLKVTFVATNADGKLIEAVKLPIKGVSFGFE